MTDPTEAYFENLGKRGHEPLLEKVAGTVRFDIVELDSHTDHWLVTIDRGDLKVQQHGDGPVDCVVHADRRTFEKFARYQINGFTALLRGDAIVEGDLLLALMLQRLPPTKPGSPEREAATAGRRTR